MIALAHYFIFRGTNNTTIVEFFGGLTRQCADDIRFMMKVQALPLGPPLARVAIFRLANNNFFSGQFTLILGASLGGSLALLFICVVALILTR